MAFAFAMVSLATLAGSPFLSAALTRQAPLPLPPTVQQIRTLPKADQAKWTAFCKTLMSKAASAKTAQAKDAKGTVGIKAPANAKITELLAKNGKAWTTLCAGWLGKTPASAAGATGAANASVRAGTAASARFIKPVMSRKPETGTAVPWVGDRPAPQEDTRAAAPARGGNTAGQTTEPSSASAAASSAPSGYKGACVIRDPNKGYPGYEDADNGEHHAKANKGSGFKSLAAIADACTQQTYDALAQTYCATHAGNTYQIAVLLYTQGNLYHESGPGYFGWQLARCPAAPPASSSAASSAAASVASSAPASSSAASSSATPTGYKGACVIRDAYTSLPRYDAPDAAQGYAKTGKGWGFTDFGAVRAACTQADYDALGLTFCAANPGGRYQREASMYNLDNSWRTTGGSAFGSSYVYCP